MSEKESRHHVIHCFSNVLISTYKIIMNLTYIKGLHISNIRRFKNTNKLLVDLSIPIYDTTTQNCSDMTNSWDAKHSGKWIINETYCDCSNGPNMYDVKLSLSPALIDSDKVFICKCELKIVDLK